MRFRVQTRKQKTRREGNISMYYLLYASTAVERMNDEQLESILEVS